MGKDSWCGLFNKPRGTQGSEGDSGVGTAKKCRGYKDTDNPTSDCFMCPLSRAKGTLRDQSPRLVIMDWHKPVEED